MQTAMALVALLAAAACERPVSDPSPVATPGLSDRLTVEVREQTADAAKAHPAAVAAPVVTPRTTGTPTRSPTRNLYPRSTRKPTPCYPAGFLNPLHWYSDQFVRWSPDSDQVLFTQGASLYAVSEDGTRLRELARGSVEIPRDSWGAIGTMIAFGISPDGERVVYSTCENPQQDLRKAIEEFGWREATSRYGYELAAIGIDGTQLQQLTKTTDFENYPAWSPDGERIAYLRIRGDGDPMSFANRATLATMAADGSERQSIVTRFDSLAMRPPQWSPDGTRLAFAGDDGESGLSLYTVRTDGTDLRKLTRTISGPSWSPDGERIAYARTDGDQVTIYTIAADGNDARRVTAIPEVVWVPSRPSQVYILTLEWSPDGSKILFVENRKLAGHDCDSPTTDGIYVVGVDGSGLVRLGTVEPEVYLYAAAAWSPDGRKIAVSAEGDSEARKVFGCDYADSAAEGVPRSTILFTMAADGSDIRLLAEAGADGRVESLGVARGDISAAVAACSAGTVVAEPEANRTLVGDCEALLEIQNALAGAGGLDWGVDKSIEQWEGVTVSGSPLRVRKIVLDSMGLRGIISPEMSRLVELRVLDLSDNALTGEIPAELGDLDKLEELNLYGNALSGAIPVELRRMKSLERLSLSRNNLSGAIPVELDELNSLKSLGLSENRLSGEIPVELGRLTHLEWLSLSTNELTGELPKELRGLTRLRYLSLASNELEGEIPGELGELVGLSELNLSDNNLTGGIPASLGRLTMLRRLHLSNNALTGEIPAELGQLRDLDELYLSGNELKGCIPGDLRMTRSTDVGSLDMLSCDYVGR